MCGLVATISFDGRPADPSMLKRTSDVLMHRGPDDFGVSTYGPVGFGFRRLAILDLSTAGHQPMESPDGQLAVVFNGEIYNYVELKHELQQLGHTFGSSSDTEVLLHAYDQWGPACVERFNGMWAFVVYDKAQRRLFASRDRFGVKPLYRWSDRRSLILASEIKAILASGWYSQDVNWRAAARFLCRGQLDEDNETLYAGIDQVPAGSTFEVDLDGHRREHRFWSLADLDRHVPADPVQSFRELFEDAVRIRMRSDVPVGVCLSGGIDSNAIISMMADLRGPDVAYPLQAFSYIPQEFSEADYIHESIACTGALLNELRPSAEALWDGLPKALWHYDEPVHSPTALVGFELMRLAKSCGVTVVLNGQGSDEVNAGYSSYFRPYWADLMRSGRWRQALDEIGKYGRAQGFSTWPLLRDAAGHCLRLELSRVPGYGALRLMRRAFPRDEFPWFDRELLQHLPPPEEQLHTLETVLTQSVERRPLPLYLRVEDRNSMAHSVEARLPFLDYRLVSLAISLPGNWKLNGPWNKQIVREAMKGVMVERVRTRLDKMGFPTPEKKWFAGPWYAPTRDLLRSQVLRESGICDANRICRDLEQHRDGQIDVARQLFHVAEFGLWLNSLRPLPPPLPVAAMPLSVAVSGNGQLRAPSTAAPMMSMEQQFAAALRRLQVQGRELLGVDNPAFRVDSFSNRPFSHVYRIQVGNTVDARHIYVKIFRPRKDTAEEFDFMVRRVSRDYETTRTLHAAMSSEADLAVVRPIACFPEHLALVTAEAPGEMLLRVFERNSHWKTTEARTKPQIIAARRTGEWLRAFQRTQSEGLVSIDAVRDYVDFRLRRLVDDTQTTFSEHDRRAVLDQFTKRAAEIPPDALRAVPVHGDLAMSNVLVHGSIITVLDLTSVGSGTLYHDLGHLYMQIGLLSAKASLRRTRIAALQRALLDGFQPGLSSTHPLFELMYLQHTVCHLVGLIQQPAGQGERLYNWWVARRHLDWLRKFAGVTGVASLREMFVRRRALSV
jgi:asparagine synthase (glutamine-hydrolysing)